MEKNDYNHIIVAELDTVLQGINVVLKWSLQNIEVRTESATVVGWLNSVVMAEKRIRKGA